MPGKKNRYCVCVDDSGAPQEITRRGAVVTYKAIDYQTGNPVALQTIPSVQIDDADRKKFEDQVGAAQKLEHENIARVYAVSKEDEHLVFASEFLNGETAEKWLVSHGPMPADAVLRIGLQVVSALREAAFQNLSHRAIQPSNIMILPGTASDGEWPLIKLLNFGLAGTRLFGKSTAELVPTMSPQFASPEQLEGVTLDFRAEVFSLGATICFLLTGAVPLLGKPTARGVVERMLPRTRAISRPMRKLLGAMLRNERQERPGDPNLLSEQMRAVLAKVERRRKAPPLVPLSKPGHEPISAAAISPQEFAPRWRGPLVAAAVLLLLLGAAAATIYPDRIRAFLNRNQPIASMGVPVGVPEVSADASATAAAPTSSRERVAIAPPEVTSQRVDRVAAPKRAVATLKPTEPPTFGANNRTPDPPPPAEGPRAEASPTVVPETAPVRNFGEQTSWARLAKQNQESIKANPQPTGAPSSPPTVAEKADSSETVRPVPPKLPPAKTRNTHVVNPRLHRKAPPMRVGTEAAEFVGTNRDGNWVLRLPSGETVVTPPAPNPLNAPVEKHGRVKRVTIPPRALPADDSPVVLPPEN